jgi:hypothetical protein
MSLRNWLIRLYPRPWRDRYADEFEILLEECLRSPLDVLDILLGALDAHLEFPYEMNWRLMNMINKLRTSILIVFASYIGFVMGGLSLYGLADDSPMAALMKTRADLPLLASWIIVEVGAVIALLAVVIGGLPVAWMVVRRVLTSSHQDFWLLLVPPLAFLVLVLYAGFMASIGLGLLHIPGVLPIVSPDDFPIGNRLLIAGAMLLFVLGAIASTASVWKAIMNSSPEENKLIIPGRTKPIKIYEYAFTLSIITSLAMLLMLAATLAWGWLAYSAIPKAFAENWGLLLTNTTGSFVVIVIVMTLSTAAAFFGVARGYSARKLV